MRFMPDPGETRLDARDVLGDCCWFPQDYIPLARTMSFVRTDPPSLAQQPFLDHRWNRRGYAQASLTLDSIAGELSPDAPLPHLNFIWHTSFCCSTLIASALNVANRNLSLSEPVLLVTAADLKRAGAYQDGKASPRLTEIALRLLARRPEPHTAITVKPSNFANTLIRDAARHTTGKSLFLYSDLPSFLLSIAKSGLQLSKYVRRLFFGIVQDDGKPLRWPAADLFQMSDLEIAAIAWHIQIAEFRRSWAELGEGRVASLDCDAFLADPRMALEKLDAFFGYGFGPETIRGIVEGPVLSRHAKLPQAPFNAEQRRIEQQAVRRFLGADLDRIAEWSYGAYAEAIRGLPLPGSLIPARK